MPSNVINHHLERYLGWQDHLTKSIRDPVYGTIRFSEEEMRVIDSEVFHRLHRIRQNGMLYLVFPAATHTRFEHSLGVVHIAQSILTNLLVNSSVAARKSTPTVASLKRAKAGQAINFAELDNEQLDYIFRVTRLAALVHDLGHGPFSHTFDSFAPRGHQIKSLLERTQGVEHFSIFLESDPNKRIKHEIMSCVLFAYLWGQLPYDSDTIYDIAAVLLGRPEICPQKKFRPFVELIHDIIASAPADADRMDYLERDSRSIGVNYGLYDRDRLLKSFLVYKENSSEKNYDAFRLGVKCSGIRAVENFIQARFQLFVQIYYHKTSRAIDIMLKSIAELAKKETRDVFSWDDLEDFNHFIDIYQELSDDRFLRILRGKDPDCRVEGKEINLLAQRIFKRELWKRVYEGKPTRTENIFKKLKTDFQNIDQGDLHFDKVDPKATKDFEDGAVLLSQGNDGIYAKHHERNWLSESSITAALKNAEKEISRIYLKKEYPPLLENLRTKAREYHNILF